MNVLLKVKSNARKFLVGIVLIATLNSFGQINLVPNPSFEQYTNCPDNSSVINGIASKPDIWYKPDTRGGGI